MDLEEFKQIAVKNNNVIPLKNKVTVIDLGVQKELSEDTRKLVEQEWDILSAQYPNIYNGITYCVDELELVDNQITLKCSRSTYSHYRCGGKHDLGKDACRNPYGGIILITKDGYLVVPLQGGDSENEGKLQAIGGGMSPEDSVNNTNILDPEITALRELEEEAGIEIRKSIYKTAPGYLITDGSKFGMIAWGYSEMSKAEMDKCLKAFQNESGNKELDRLLFWNKDNLNDLTQYETKQDLGVVQFIRTFHHVNDLGAQIL